MLQTSSVDQRKPTAVVTRGLAGIDTRDFEAVQELFGTYPSFIGLQSRIGGKRIYEKYADAITGIWIIYNYHGRRFRILEFAGVLVIDDIPEVVPIFGCTNPAAVNYNSEANTDDGSCILSVPGCLDVDAINYNPLANVDDASCIYGAVGDYLVLDFEDVTTPPRTKTHFAAGPTIIDGLAYFTDHTISGAAVSPFYTTYAKTLTDTMGIVDPQCALHVPFDFKQNWTRIVACLFCSMTDSATDPNEGSGWFHQMTGDGTSKSMFSVGFKDSGDVLPGDNGSKFIGYTVLRPGAPGPYVALNRSGSVPSVGYLHVGAAFLRGAYIDETAVSGAVNDYSFGVGNNAGIVGPTMYNAKHLFSLTVVDRGLATQSLKIYVSNVSGTGQEAEGDTVSALAACDALVDGVEIYTIPWQSGGVPYDLPTKFFIHTPMSPERLRVSNLVIKVLT